MNSQTRAAHLKLLGPAPAGMKWRMVKTGEIIPVGKYVVPHQGICRDTLIVGQTRGVSGEGRAEWWHLVPVAPKLTHFDALATFRRIMGAKLEDLDRDQTEAIVADFIGSHCRKEDFVAYVKAAKKGLKV